MPDASTPPIGDVHPELVTKLDALARQIDNHVGGDGTGIIYFETFDDDGRRPCTRSEHYQYALDAAFRGAAQIVAEYSQLPDCPTTAAEPVAGLHGIRQWCERCKRVAGSTDAPTGGPSRNVPSTITAPELAIIIKGCSSRTAIGMIHAGGLQHSEPWTRGQAKHYPRKAVLGLQAVRDRIPEP